MPEEYKLQTDTIRAAKAKDLLENDLLAESFEALKKTYFNQLMATNAMQGDVREKCYLALRIVDVVRDHLTKIVSDGALAKADLNELAKVTERKKRFGIV